MRRVPWNSAEHRIHTTNYSDIRPHLRDGDIALFRGGGLISRVSGEWTHAGILIWLRDEKGIPLVLYLTEMRELRGGRSVTLSSQVRYNPGEVDIFRPRCSQAIRTRAALLSARLSGHKYGYQDIWRAFTKRLDLLQAVGLVKIDRHSTTLSTWDTPRDCSRHTLWCYRRAAWDLNESFELLPRTNEKLVEPSNIATTPAVELIARGLTRTLDLTGEVKNHVVQ